MSDRRKYMEELECLRGSRIITYITGDREYCHAQIGDDAVRPLFDVLRQMGKAGQIDLFLYSRGGAAEVPWRIASALRQYSDGWSILIPFRANSAATLLALGADEIIFGKHGELGPIDPIQYFQKPGSAAGEGISVEDVMAYLRFTQEEVGLSDQVALAQSLAHLSQNIGAVSLGSVHRIRSHIRDVALRMLASQKEPLSERIRETIVDTLATKVYAHGHAIGFQEAKAMNLRAVAAQGDVEKAMWKLWCAYEQDLKIREAPDISVNIAEKNKVEEIAIAVVESKEMTFEFRGQFVVNVIQQMPSHLQITPHLQLPSDWKPDINQDALQEFLQQIKPEIERAVHQSLTEQISPNQVRFGFKGGKWMNTSREEAPNSIGR